jgi:hypothetical protein
MMKQLLLLGSMFAVILLSSQTDFTIYQWEWLIIEEDYVDLDYSEAIDGNRFNVKARSTKSMDYANVRVFLYNRVIA